VQLYQPSKGLAMDLTNTAALISAFLSLGVYTTIVCYFFYKLNANSIEKNEDHWREMFMYMNNRIDHSKERNNHKKN
jgi:hypothetical protein